MAQFIKTKEGFIVDNTNDIAKGYPLFITAKNAEEICEAFPLSLCNIIYGRRAGKKIEKVFQANQDAENLEDNSEINTIVQTICELVEKNDEFWQEMSDLDWEMEKAMMGWHSGD